MTEITIQNKKAQFFSNVANDNIDALINSCEPVDSGSFVLHTEHGSFIVDIAETTIDSQSFQTVQDSIQYISNLL